MQILYELESEGLMMYWQGFSSALWFMAIVIALVLIVVLLNQITHKIGKIVRILETHKGECK